MEFVNMKIYHDPHYKPGDPIEVGYKGITKWSQETNDRMKAKLDSLDYNALTDEEKSAYNDYREYIRIWETTGKDPISDAGFFYCPYIPEGFNDKCLTFRSSLAKQSKNKNETNIS